MAIATEVRGSHKNIVNKATTQTTCLIFAGTPDRSCQSVCPASVGDCTRLNWGYRAWACPPPCTLITLLFFFYVENAVINMRPRDLY